MSHVVAATMVPRLDDEGAFLYCMLCGDIHRVSRADRSPEYDVDGTAIAHDDAAAYLARHVNHPLRVLRRSSDAEVHSHARHDPMRRVSWEVSDGAGRFVVTSEREGVESPVRYSIVPGRLVVVAESIEIDAPLVARVMDEVIYPRAAAPSRLQWLLNSCGRLVSSLSWDALDPIDEDREDPNVQLACLPESICGWLRGEVARLFPGEEGIAIASLVERELRFSIPVVRMRRKYSIEAEP